MTWFDTIPTLIAAAAIIFIPGAVLARTLGARGITWLALSAPLTMSLIGIGALGAQIINVRWTLLALAALTALASAVSWAVRYVLEIRRRKVAEPLWVRSPNATIAGLVGGLAVAVGVIGFRLVRIFINPQNISQTYDNVFHLNAVRYILDTGKGSSLHLGNLDPSTTISFYPGVWHDLVALVVQTTGSSIPVSLNAVNIILASVVWTVSAMYLATRALGSRPAVYLATGALAGAFSAFPYLLLDFGVLYPNFLAITLLPVMIALLVDVLQMGRPSHPGTVRGIVLMVFCLPGLALSHPNIAIALGAFALPVIALWLYRQVRSYRARTLPLPWLLVSAAAAVVFFLALKFVWEKFRPSEKASFWPPTQTVAQALGEALANAPMGAAVSWTVIGLTVLGLYALVRSRQNLWLLGVLGVGVFLFVVVSGFEKTELRSSLTGIFYNDSYRLAALLPVAGLAVAVYGAVWLFDLACAALNPSPTQDRRLWLAAMAAGTVAILAVGFLAQGNSVENAEQRARMAYTSSPNSPLLSSDEAALIARAGKTIPPNATVIASPSTGASLVYALANRRVILPAVGSTPSEADQVVMNQFAQLATNPAVCDAVRSLDAFYVLDFGPRQVNNLHIPFPGSAVLAATPGLVLVDQQGPAKLYRIEACR